MKSLIGALLVALLMAGTAYAGVFGPPEPLEASFFDSPFFAASFDPANGPLGACGGYGCDAFSAGVLGKNVK